MQHKESKHMVSVINACEMIESNDNILSGVHFSQPVFLEIPAFSMKGARLTSYEIIVVKWEKKSKMKIEQRSNSDIQEIIFIHNQSVVITAPSSPWRADQRRNSFSRDLAALEPIFVEDAVLRKHLGVSIHVHQSLKDGVESYIDEFRIRFFGRVGHASDLVGFTAILHLFESQRLRIQAQASCMVCANVPIPLQTTESRT